MTYREEIIGDCRLILGDCRDILPTLGRVDAVVTDPPYGIGIDGNSASTGGHGGRKAHEKLNWDSHRPCESIFAAILQQSDQQIIWGGNYFADLLPPTMGWLVWDKGQRINQSDGELAWTSRQNALRIITMNRVELLKDGTSHPTQKPIQIMNWCLDFLPTAQTVLDPFMGSGTTGVACVKRGKSFIGIEREEAYFDIACRRIEEAYKQPDFFVSAPEPKAIQPSMFEGGA